MKTRDLNRVHYLDLCGEACYCWLRRVGELANFMNPRSKAHEWYAAWLDQRMQRTCPKLAAELADLEDSEIEYIWSYVRCRTLLRQI